MTLDFTVTRRILTLGSRDSVTGWHEPTWIEETIEPFYMESKGVNYLGSRLGAYAYEDAVGVDYDELKQFDQIKTYDGAYFLVLSRDKKRAGNSLICYVYQLRELPLWQTPPTPAGISTYLTSPSDARWRTKYFLDTKFTLANFIDNNGDTASIVVMYADPPYPVASEFRAEDSPVSGVFTVGSPTSSEALLDLVDNKPYAYKEIIPITVYTMDSASIRGVAFMWRMEAELRRIFEENPSGSYRWLNRSTPKTERFGAEVLYGTEWQVEYTRNLTA